MTISIEKVKCKIPGCGKHFSTLVTHLKRTHHLSSKEYLRRFPNTKLTSDEYRKNISNTAKNRFLLDPTLRGKVTSRTFDFVKNKRLTQLLQRDYKDAKVCLRNTLWKASIILYGSIIEAILIEKHPKSKNFNDAIIVSHKKNDISDIENHKIHIIRDLRNLVHLHKELSENSDVINEHWAKTAADICEALIKRFQQSK